MVLNIFLSILLFLLLCAGNGCLIFFLWWIIGQPHPTDQQTAQFTQGRILSGVGRRLCDWYESFAQKEEERILDMLLEDNYDSEQQRNEAYYVLSRKHRRPNPAKAFGVCPVCMGTYVTVLVNGIVLGFIGCFISWPVMGILSIPVLAYGWAFSLTFLKKLFLTD
jgi:hypothetical protein